jgi:hypothetical protein
MRWSAIVPLAAGMLAFPAAAFACINDREVETHERQFKSRYNAPAPAPSTTPTPSPAPEPAGPTQGGSNLPGVLAGVGIGGGGALLLAAVAVTLMPSRPARSRLPAAFEEPTVKGPDSGGDDRA